MDRLYGEIHALRNEACMINGHQLWRTNLRLHNICLRHFTDDVTDDPNGYTIHEYNMNNIILDDKNVEHLLGKIALFIYNLIVQSLLSLMFI
jgi:hypothetical protein